ncbi:restriction endonuclease subunit S [Chitinophagaceae bacterium LWZ2-11]
MNKNKKLIPTLRFPEFEKEEEWEEKTLGEVTENVMYGMNAAAVEYDGQNKYIRITDIDENSRSFLPDPLTSPDGPLEEKYIVNVGDLLFARTGASVGKSYLHQKEDGKIYFAGFLIRFAIKNVVPYFIYAQTLTEQYQKWVSKTSMRSGQPGINAEEYKSYPIVLPLTIEEQKKIASCLSSLDEVITANNQKLEQLKEHKKGLMQNLFPQEEEMEPKYRFPEFVNDGEWVDKKLEELLEIGNGKDYKHLGKGEIPVYGSGGYMLSVDDYLYEGDSACIGRKGTIDKPIFLTGKFWTVDTLFYTHSFNDCIPKFIYYIFQNINWLKHNEAGGVPSLSKSNINKIKSIIPKLNEQQKIVDILSVLDELITSQMDKIDQLKLHKKGLMQGLFPKMND